MVKIIIVLGIIATFSMVVHQSDAALKCYLCGPEIIAPCPSNDEFSTAYEFTCIGGETKCLKATVSLKNGSEYTVRGCDGSAGCTFIEDPLVDDIDCHNCDSDLCNSSEWNVSNMLTMCLTVFIGLLVSLK